MVRIPPIRWKKDVFYNGKEQTPEDRKGEAKYTSKTIPTGCGRAVKRAAIARGVPKDIGRQPEGQCCDHAAGADHDLSYWCIGHDHRRIYSDLYMARIHIPTASHGLSGAGCCGHRTIHACRTRGNVSAGSGHERYCCNGSDQLSGSCIRVPCFHGTDHLLLGDSNSHAGYQVADQVLGTAGMLP